MPNNVRYVGPIDEVLVVGVGVVNRGDEFTPYSDAHEAQLLEQPDMYAPAQPAAGSKKRGKAAEKED